jgi:hypothetical protein
VTSSKENRMLRTIRSLCWLGAVQLYAGLSFAFSGAVLSVLLVNLGHDVRSVSSLGEVLGWLFMATPLFAVALEPLGDKGRLLVTFQAGGAGTLVLASLAVALDGSAALIAVPMAALALCTAAVGALAGGLYLELFRERAQAALLFPRSASWALGPILATGGAVYWVGQLASNRGFPFAWALVLAAGAATLALLLLASALGLPPAAPAEAASSGGTWLGTVWELLVAFLRKPAARYGVGLVFAARIAEVLLDGAEQQWLTTALGQGAPVHSLVLSGKAVGGAAGLLLGGTAIAILRLRRALLILASAAVPAALAVLTLLWVHPSHPLTLGGLVTLHGLFASVAGAAVLVYLMQQAAPGRFVMSHFGLAIGAQSIVGALGRPLASTLGGASGPTAVAVVATLCALLVPAIARVAPVHERP